MLSRSLQLLQRLWLPGVGILLLLLVSACSSPLTPTTPASGNAYGNNLIVNPGAEDGSADTGADAPVKKIPGWTQKGDCDVVPYGADGVVGAQDPGPSNRGKNLFTGGPDSPQTSLTQTIDVSAESTDIQSGSVSYTLSGYLGGYSSQDDHATLTLQFKDTSGKVLGTASIGPVTAQDRQNTTELLQRSTNGKLPSGTTSVIVTLTMTRVEGAYNDGYADNLSLVLQKG